MSLEVANSQNYIGEVTGISRGYPKKKKDGTYSLLVFSSNNASEITLSVHGFANRAGLSGKAKAEFERNLRLFGFANGQCAWFNIKSANDRHAVYDQERCRNSSKICMCRHHVGVAMLAVGGPDGFADWVQKSSENVDPVALQTSLQLHARRFFEQLQVSVAVKGTAMAEDALAKLSLTHEQSGVAYDALYEREDASCQAIGLLESKMRSSPSSLSKAHDCQKVSLSSFAMDRSNNSSPLQIKGSSASVSAFSPPVVEPAAYAALQRECAALTLQLAVAKQELAAALADTDAAIKEASHYRELYDRSLVYTDSQDSPMDGDFDERSGKLEKHEE